ncbi:Variant surface glycoprotein [Trypanosoma congolense IL3000]|uniref:Variant surface glycoprotein n=1 Tax=Trypanosoma congolense (strain IL3000) TaxID=1068625 RepID=F9WD08_TRYCI|nr:Variant surface glycoprotein [Trypanosoma congolense IL3000]
MSWCFLLKDCFSVLIEKLKKEKMTRTKIWMMVMMFFGVASSAEEKNHNGAQHKALCDLLKIAVHKWNELKSRGSDGPLKKALVRTIFGDDSGEDLVALKREALPTIYVDVEKKKLSRLIWCGDPFEEGGLLEVGQSRWPGFSAPHDLLCLCTVGTGGYPFNNAGSATALCGKPKTTLRADEKKGWSSAGGEAGDQMKATWTNIVGECLQEGGKASDLKKALGDFLGQLEKRSLHDIPDRYQLGEGESDRYPCGGGGTVCVMYYNGTSVKQKKHAIPWWTELEEAINNQAEAEQAYTEQEQKKTEEKPKGEGQNQHHQQKHEETQPQQAHRTAALRSAPQHSQETEQKNTENISTPIATLEETSGTSIIPPCTWFLGAFLML